MNGTTKEGYSYHGCTGFHEDCNNVACYDNPFHEVSE